MEVCTVNRGAENLCCICFSDDRNVTFVGDLYDVYHDLLEDHRLLNHVFDMKLNVCWECRSMLLKIRHFKERVNSAQKCLKGSMSTETLILQCKSKLKTIQPKDLPIIDVIYEEECLNSLLEELPIGYNSDTDTELKLEETSDNKVKIELEEATEDINQELKLEAESDFDNEESFLIQDSLTFLRQAKKEKNSQKSKDYTVITNERRIKKDEFTQKRIPFHDFKYWFERDRQCDYFKNVKYKCDLCLETFRRKKTLDEHNRDCHNMLPQMYVCDVCTKSFTHKTAIAQHVGRHTYLFSCRACHFSTAIRTHIKEHIERCHNLFIKCNLCGLRFRTRVLFKRHFKSSHRSYICDDCGKHFKSKVAIQHHMEDRHIQYRCRKCNICFKNRRTYRSHDVLVHCVAADPELAYCVECDKQFVNESRFKRHLRSHRVKDSIKVKNVKCPECDNVYARKQYMLNHYALVHQKQTKYYCKICDKYYLNRTRFVEHSRYRHEGLKRVKNKLCNICGTGFSTNRILEKHVRTHTGERPYPCEYCDARFTQKVSMQSHVNHIHLKLQRPKLPKKYT